MGIQVCSNEGAGPFLGPSKGKIRKMLINIKKLITGRNLLILDMEHPWGKEIKVCANEVPGVINDQFT